MPDLNGHVPHRMSYNDPIARNMMVDAINNLANNLNTTPTQFARGARQGLDDPRRSIEDECGYPPLDAPIEVTLCRQLFDRNPIANRAIHLMPKEAFQKSPTVYEIDPSEPTVFNKAWKAFGKRLGVSQSWHEDDIGSRVWDYLQRGVVRSRIGTFGIVLALIKDGKNLQEPVDGLVTINARSNRGKGRAQYYPIGRPPMPDSPITLSEIKRLLRPPARKVWQRYDVATNKHEYKEVPGHKLTKAQRKIVLNWLKEARAQERRGFNPPFMEPTYEIAINELATMNARKAQANGKPKNPQLTPEGFNPNIPYNPGTADDGSANAPPPDPQERGKGKPPLEPNNTFPEPYQTGTFHPFDPFNPKPNPQFIDPLSQTSAGTSRQSTSAGGSKDQFSQDAKANGENPGGKQEEFRTQSGGVSGGTNIAIPGAYGTDREYGTSDGAMSAGYGMAAPSGYGQLSGTDQQYYGVQIGPSEQPSMIPPGTKVGLPGDDEGLQGGKSNEGGDDELDPNAPDDSQIDEEDDTEVDEDQIPEFQGREVDFRVYDETLVEVVRYEWNINNPRFGMPVMYRVNLNDPRFAHSGIGLPLATVFVHWTRVLHLTDKYTNSSTSEIFSPPVLEPILENVLDVRKVPAAAAEGYWQSGIPTWVFETHPQLGGDVLFNTAATQDMMEMMFNSLQKWISGLGGTWNPKGPTITDPSKFIEIFITLICIQLACPVRVFKGSERGELASSQDDSKWNDVVRGYQNGFLTPWVICPFIDWMIMLKVLPEPESYQVDWPDLDSMSDAQKATVFQTRIAAYAAAEQGGVYNTVPKREVMTKMDFFTDDEADNMEDEAKREAEEDMQTQLERQQELGFEPLPDEGFHDPEATADLTDKQHEVDMAAAKNPAGPPGHTAGASPPKPPSKGGPPKPGAAGKPPAPPKAPPGQAGQDVKIESLTGNEELDRILNASYFSDCERDEHGWCEPGSETGMVSVGGNLKAAARALAQGKYVRLDQPDQVATLLDKMHEMVQKAVAKGKDAPKFDLCKVSVPGTNLFCQETKGVPRVRMPQVKGVPTPGSESDTFAKNKKGEVDATAPFIIHMRQQGIDSELTSVRASHLRASQNEIDGAKIADLVTNRSVDELRKKPIFVTKDNYILDGHHHWAAIIGKSAEKGKDFKIPVHKLDCDIMTAIKMTNEYTRKIGIKPKSTPASETATKNVLTRFWNWITGNVQERDDHGRFAPSEQVAAAIAHVSRRGRTDSDIDGDHQLADKMVEQMKVHQKADLYHHLTKGGVVGIRPHDTKAGMLQRLHNTITATARLRDRTEV